MDATVAAAAAVALTGAAVGLAAGLAFRSSERARKQPVERPQQPLPEGVDRVLAVLRSNSLVIDENGGLVHATPGAYAFGVARQGRLAVPELEDLARQVHRDGEIREVQFEQRAAHREPPRVLSARVAPLSTSLVLVLVEDRTQAHRVDEIRRDFVANVSHELKTPIGAVSLLAEAVSHASDDPEAVRRFASRMRGETDRLARLIQEIIDLSRLQYDDPIDSPELVAIDDVVGAALERCQVDADAKGIGLSTSFGGQSARTARVLGSGSQLVMALGNLVENAVAYSPDGAPVGIQVATTDDSVDISVVDQGIGIADHEIGRIFERFYRIDPARSRATGGTGLGLSIVKHVAASHGGQVVVRSVPGEGSTFTLRLPPAPQDRLNLSEPMARGERTVPPVRATPAERAVPSESATRVEPAPSVEPATPFESAPPVEPATPVEPAPSVQQAASSEGPA